MKEVESFINKHQRLCVIVKVLGDVPSFLKKTGFHVYLQHNKRLQQTSPYVFFTSYQPYPPSNPSKWPSSEQSKFLRWSNHHISSLEPFVPGTNLETKRFFPSWRSFLWKKTNLRFTYLRYHWIPWRFCLKALVSKIVMFLFPLWTGVLGRPQQMILDYYDEYLINSSL